MTARPQEKEFKVVIDYGRGFQIVGRTETRGEGQRFVWENAIADLRLPGNVHGVATITEQESKP